MTPKDIERELSGLANPSPSAGTKEAILRRLEGDMDPVRPLHAPWIRAAAASMAGLAVAVAVAGSVGVRPLGVGGITLFVLLASIAFLASWLAMRSVVPAVGPTRPWRLSLVAVPLLLGGLVVLFAGTGGILGPARCLNLGLMFAVMPWVPAAWLLRRGAGIAPSFAGACAGMAAGSWSLSMLHLTCPMMDGAHLLVWHGALLMICTGLGLVIGSLVFRHAGGKRPT